MRLIIVIAVSLGVWALVAFMVWTFIAFANAASATASVQVIPMHTIIAWVCEVAAVFALILACPMRWPHNRIALVVFFATAFAAAVLAAPPSGSDGHLHAFYESLKQPHTDLSCCSESDCRPVDYRIEGDHYVATRADGSQVDIDPSIIIHRSDNPVGRAILCELRRSGLQFCFLPWGSGT